MPLDKGSHVAILLILRGGRWVILHPLFLASVLCELSAMIADVGKSSM